MDNIEYIMMGFSSELEKVAAPPVVPAAKAVLKGIGGGLSRFGKRQVHALTGWTPKAGIRSIRGGAYDAAQRLEQASGALTPGVGPRVSNLVEKPGIVRRAVDKVMRTTPKQVQARALDARKAEEVAAIKQYGSAAKAERMGLTSLPGYAKALKTHGVGKTMKAGFKEQWDSMGPAGRALMVGFPAVGVGGELARESQPGESGRLSRAGSRLGDVAYMMGPVPVAGQIAAQMAVGGAGKRVGALFDKKPAKQKNVPAPESLEPAGGEAAPGERIVSDRAMGLGGGIQGASD